MILSQKIKTNVKAIESRWILAGKCLAPEASKKIDQCKGKMIYELSIFFTENILQFQIYPYLTKSGYLPITYGL
jgi:hypothetical protein